MQMCPNCGIATARTEDWTCQWCGYPLLSNAWKKIPKTFKQLQDEKLRKVAPLETEETTERSFSPGIKPPARESMPEPILPSKIEPPPLPRTELVPEIKPQPQLPVYKPVLESKAEPTTEPEAKPELPPGVMDTTVEQLCSAHESDKAAAIARFKDKVIRITGLVSKVVVRDDLGIRYAILTGNRSNNVNVRCTFDPEYSTRLMRLTAGQRVIVQGKYEGYERNIILKNCILVSP